MVESIPALLIFAVVATLSAWSQDGASSHVVPLKAFPRDHRFATGQVPGFYFRTNPWKAWEESSKKPTTTPPALMPSASVPELVALKALGSSRMVKVPSALRR